MLITAESDPGRTLIDRIGLTAVEEPADRNRAIADLHQKRTLKRAEHLKSVSEKINTIDKFLSIVGTCLNCYNCRVACPVCYCRECVFLTDVFDHSPEILLRRSEKRGNLKLPTDTAMFHLTRLAHMSHACVGCGHCTSVCPSRIPVADIFMTVSAEVQSLFDYIPGRSVDEKPPLTVFEQKTHE
jgi:formate dehydrogenase subunit beta